MTNFVHGTKSRIWIDGFPASCVLSEFSSSTDIDTAETTTLCKTAKNYIAGLEDGSASVSGFYDIDALNPELTFSAFMEARLRQVFPVLYAPMGDPIAGDPVFIMNGLLTSYNVGSTTDGAVTLDTDFQTSDGNQVSEVILGEGARTTSGESAVRDGGAGNAPSTGGFSALLSVSKVTGTTPTLAVKFQDSADNSTFADISGGAFTSTNVQDGKYIVYKGNVRRYVKVVYTIAGTTPSFTFNVAWNRK